jgi:exopolysaccharide biosynthesis protein
VAAVLAPPNPQAPSSPAKAPALTQVFIRGIHFEGASFDARSHRLLVIDQSNGPASTFATSQEVARQYDALLALNAGFFTPDGDPLGLVISKGKQTGAWNSASSLGSGIFSESATGHLSITRRDSPTAFLDARELIQAGPLLTENGGAVGGLDAGKIAVRSILLTDGGTRWWIGKTSACSLAGLGEALASQSPAAWPVQHALNLDGGRSTDLYVSARIPGGSFERRSFLNRPVRNFLILKPK